MAVTQASAELHVIRCLGFQATRNTRRESPAEPEINHLPSTVLDV